VDERRKRLLGAYLRNARKAAGFSQSALAVAARVSRIQVVRAEQGRYILDLDEAVRIAEVLKTPLERFTTGHWRPGSDLRGIALELFHLGIRDLEVSAPHVPGAFRSGEQVLAAALKGDQPEPRVVEAIPLILALRKLNVPLTVAFADSYDSRIRTRLAWLSDITLTLSQLSTFPTEVKWEAQLKEFLRAGMKRPEPDSLGHPREGVLPRLWAKWNITYAGDLKDFERRVVEVEAAYRRWEIYTEDEE
jgi:transcriptional regulator with XRE-family HTH domain